MNSPVAPYQLPKPVRVADPALQSFTGLGHAVKRLSEWTVEHTKYQQDYIGGKVQPNLNSAVQGVGLSLISAGSITVSAAIHHVTGSAAISTIIPANTQFSGPVWLIADGAWTLMKGGNIAFTASPSIGQHVAVIYDPATATWYPEEGSGGGTGNANFVDNEVPAGTVGGGNTVFALASTPVAGSVHLYRNGVRQSPGTDFNIAGATITFIVAPVSGDRLLADYRK